MASLLDRPLRDLLAALRCGDVSVGAVAEAVIAREPVLRTSRALTFFDPTALRNEAARLDRRGRPRRDRERPLFGLPVSVKDLYDVRGMPTGCGSSFYARLSPVPRRDSAYVARWRAAGALIGGKTHLNEFAYGITGENPHLGDCLQPRDLRLLTGGSSSGAAASVQGGFAAVGLGTDTGGSLRVPAALCGLTSFRQSTPGRRSPGMFPLATSFDSCGWLQRDVGDVAEITSALFGPASTKKRAAPWRIACLTGPWLDVCESEILDAYETFLRQIARWRCVRIIRHAPAGFASAPEIFSPIQAYEAARFHRSFLKKHAADYDPAVRGRLEWGKTLTAQNNASFQRERCRFTRGLRELWAQADLLLAPACPFRELPAGENFDSRRRAILQLTTPFSLAGLPVLTVPRPRGVPPLALQIAAPRHADARLVAFSRDLAGWL